VRRLPTLLVGAAAGALAATAFVRRRGRPEPPRERGAPDPRASELREKLAQAREAAAEEDAVEAAEQGVPTTVLDDPKPPPPPGPSPPPPRAPVSPVDPDPPRDEFEAMRRRVREEAEAAAAEMRRSADDEPEPA
jgi:hypothetical protein